MDKSSQQKIVQFNEILSALGLPTVALEKAQTKQGYNMEVTKQEVALNEVRRGGFIIGSIDASANVSFAINPVIHNDAQSARAECKRLAGINPGKAFIFVKLVGAELVPTQRAISI